MTDVIFLSWRRRAMLHIPSNFHTIPGPRIFFFLIRMSKFLPSLLNYDFSLASWSFPTLQRQLPPSSSIHLPVLVLVYWQYCLLLDVPWNLLVKRIYTEPRQAPFFTDDGSSTNGLRTWKDPDSDRGSKALANRRGLLNLTDLTFRMGVPGCTS